MSDTDTEPQPTGELMTLELPTEQLQMLSVSERRIGLRIVPFGTVAVHPTYGALMFEPGAFGDVDPRQVRLRMDHDDPPTGLGRAFDERADGAYMEFQLSKTPRADEQLTLAVDGVSRGASIGYAEVKRPAVRQIGGRNVNVYGPGSCQLAEVSTTWMPTFSEAGVMYVLHNREQEGKSPVAESQQEAPAVGAVDTDKILGAIADTAKAVSDTSKANDERIEKILSASEQLVEQQRAQFSVPAAAVRQPKMYDWAAAALRLMSGQAVSPRELQELALDDVITSEQPGLVPEVFTSDFDDLIDTSRPFCGSIREIAPPATGMTMTLPKLTSRATGYTQSSEKQTLATGTVAKVGKVDFPYIDIIGAADISAQFILRADRSAVDLIMQEMAEAYALDCDTAAIGALLGASSGPVDGGVLDPEAFAPGAAWQTAITVYRRAPDTIWMSSFAVSAFIDAKAPLTNAPLYSNLAAAFTAGSGVGGVLSGLRPIYVPALDSSGVDVIIGPSRSYVWAEVPALRLAADNPSVAGRDVALVGGAFFGPRFADAFTTFTVAS